MTTTVPTITASRSPLRTSSLRRSTPVARHVLAATATVPRLARHAV